MYQSIYLNLNNEPKMYMLNQENPEYDQKMILKYQDKITEGELDICNESELISLKFIQNFDVQELSIDRNFKTVIDLKSKTIKVLKFKVSPIVYTYLSPTDFSLIDMELENLEVLQLSENKLNNQSILNLSKFKKLRYLDLYKNFVDSNCVFNLTGLTQLGLCQCNLENINGLSANINLEGLDVSINSIIDLTPLKYLVKLTYLNLCSLVISDISILQYLVNLKGLYLSNNTLYDLTPLQYLVQLTKLELRQMRQQIVDLSVLKYLTQLEQLNLSQNNDLDLSPLQYLVNLTMLDLSNCNLKNVPQLNNLVNLESLCLNNNDELNITQLYCTKLQWLYLSNCDLRSVSTLKSICSLQYLDLDGNADIDITALQYLTNLTQLSLKQCNLISISVLRPLINLETLNLDTNNIIYLEPLQCMNSLYDLIVERNLIQNFQPIQQLRFNNYVICNQGQPSKEDLKAANTQRDINSQIDNLKTIQSTRIRFYTSLNQMKVAINIQTTNLRYNHISFVRNIAHLFQQLNVIQTYE
ncbi:leucine-rich_repeat domain-containing protein [Hexamita inflata]|uniref:Leucine-rich repeat domain-containing protein n=1 Tax=Hexamita inflata TaxID=28002 RepID=A0AA86P2I3_9EUKA|nr:leucine-rich repeat domain-containing protein [Hexamita inflata]